MLHVEVYTETANIGRSHHDRDEDADAKNRDPLSSAEKSRPSVAWSADRGRVGRHFLKDQQGGRMDDELDPYDVDRKV